jgi:NAD(P)-dependent dehydrogenase (short-subunit alcohol dehydrogenase family)
MPNRVALVTGGTRGIGAAITRRLAARRPEHGPLTGTDRHMNEAPPSTVRLVPVVALARSDARNRTALATSSGC